MYNKMLQLILLMILGIFVPSQLQEVFPQKSPLDVSSDETRATATDPRLELDKGYFAFGENVVLRGSGFEPFELLNLSVRRTDETSVPLVNGGLLLEWAIVTDENGAFASNWVMSFEGFAFRAEAISRNSKYPISVDFLLLAPSVNIDQCRNGPIDTPNICTGSAWVNGNLNGSQAHYVEGDSVPYRITMTDVPIGAHSITIEYDSTESGKHAIDYPTTYNRTEVAADPCTGVSGCNPASFTTWAIPSDPMVTAGPDGVPLTGDDIVQVSGNFTLWGGTITGVSAYTLDGVYSGSSKTRITINFDAAQSTLVLAWGGHIARRQDWGADHSAIAISGSPYHMRIYDFDGGTAGNQDRSLQSGAVYYPARITIIKDAQPDSTLVFPFTAVGTSLSNFTLDDDGDNANTYPNTKVFDGLTSFGAGHATITENAGTGYWNLTQINCTSDPRGGTGTNNNVISLPERKVEVVLEEGEYVTCTFVNAVITAASVSISGQVLDGWDNGIPRAILTLTNIVTGEQRHVISSPMGFYMFEEVTSGEDYILSISAKQYAFVTDSIAIKPTDSLTNVNFRALK